MQEPLLYESVFCIDRKVLLIVHYGNKQPLELQSRYALIWTGLRQGVSQSIALMLRTCLFALDCADVG